MSWEPAAIIKEDWGYLQIVIDDKDVTVFRGIPTVVRSWSSSEPFSDSSAVISFPQISPFEQLGSGDLHWLDDWRSVEINVIRPGGEKTVLWEGMIASLEDEQTETSSAIQAVCMGALFQVDLYVRAPLYLHEPRTVVSLMRLQFSQDSRGHLRTYWQTKIEPDPEGIDSAWDYETKRSGSWNKSLTGFIQDELALMTTDEEMPRQWTLMKDPGRKPVLRMKDYWNIHAVATVGTPGITHQLSHDQTQSSNVIYGEGTDQAGTVWRNHRGTTNRYTPLAWKPTVHSEIPWWVVLDDDVEESFPNKYTVLYTMFIYAKPDYNGQIERGEMATVLTRFLRHFGYTMPSPPSSDVFNDISSSAYKDEINILGSLGIAQGYGDGSYRPDEMIRRAEAASLFVRAAEWATGEDLPIPPNPYPDIDGHPHEENIRKAYGAGFLIGYTSGNFIPQRRLTRLQSAGVIYNYADYFDLDLPTDPRFLVDANEVRVEVHYGYGAGVSVRQAQRSARGQLIRDMDSGWIGTITFRSDPENMSRYEFMAGQNLLYKHFRPRDWIVNLPYRTMTTDDGMELKVNFDGAAFNNANQFEGRIMHIAAAEVDTESMNVALTVDTKFRDLLSLAELIARNHEGHLDPAKRLRLGRSDIPNDEKEPWDYSSGSGFIPIESFLGDGIIDGRPSPAEEPDYYVHVPAKTWITKQIRAADKASIMRTEFRAFHKNGNPKRVPFHVSFYGHSKVPSDFHPEPFNEGVWDETLDDVYAGLPSGFIVGWGQYNQRAGFWPGLDSEGDPVTGVFIDEGTWQFELNERLIEPGIWVALWCPEEAWFQGRLMQGVD